MSRLLDRFALTLLVSVLVLGCARRADTVAPEPLLPETPDGTVLAVAKHLADHDPGILWEALPPSYRTDINDLTRAFAAAMDAELYDRSMALLRRAVEVLQEKQPIILRSQTVAGSGVDVAALERGMTGALAAGHALLTSPVATLEGLGAIDWQKFLSTTGGQLMTLADGAPAAGAEAPAEQPLAMLRGLKVETVSTTGDTAVLRLTSGDREPKEIKLTRVEGRWVPTEMAEQWPQKVAEAKAKLAELTPERFAELKPQALMGLAMAEGFVGQVAAIQTPEEFDAAVGPMIEAVMGNLAFLPQGGTEEETPAETEDAPPAGEGG
ncbi:MAG: hypothetical protein MUE90_11880 [Thermoanaerobaculales bacterium]|jgi:hypothetical protein|nr:hypothetical protein [Thermoanaerobaculales bacterium]